MSKSATGLAPAVEVATSRDTSYSIKIDADFQDYSKKLFTLLCHRSQWAKVAPATTTLVKDCRNWLEDHMPICQEAIDDAATRDVIEVRIAEAADESVRRFPWEFVLAEMTRGKRKREGLLVIRQLLRAAPAKPTTKQQNGARPSVLFVSSEPGKLAGTFYFDAEEKIVRASFESGVKVRGARARSVGSATVTSLSDPTLEGVAGR